MEQKGIFINYQMAEAIDLIGRFDINTSAGRAMAEQALDELKKRWLEDTIPGTKIKIGNSMVGMQDITIDDIIQLLEMIEQSETLSVEGAGAFQHILTTDEGKKFSFDFTKLDIIAKLARDKGKKLIIDSAVVFGDYDPYKIANLGEEEISMLIAEYIKRLTSEYGDVIERIDVFNAIFQRGQISERNPEEFWIKTFGENYAQKIIDIVRANIDFSKYDIKLGWNEFYLTNSNYQNRKDDFLDMIRSIRGLDVIGIQDRFRSGESIDYILEVLDDLSAACRESNKKICVTEFSCSASGDDLRKNPTSVIDEKIQNILNAVKRYCSTNDTVQRIEGHVSDKFDFNHQELKNHGFEISTLGKKQINPKPEAQQPIQQEQPKRQESFAQRSQSELQIAELIRQKNQGIKQKKAQQKQQDKPMVKSLTQHNPNGGTNGNKGYAHIIVLSLIISFVTGALFMVAYMLLVR